MLLRQNSFCSGTLSPYQLFKTRASQSTESQLHPWFVNGMYPCTACVLHCSANTTHNYYTTAQTGHTKLGGSFTMGYDVDRFVGSINEGLLFCICRDVLEDPLQAPCEHAYCAACIHGWLVHEEICPEDRQPLTQDQLRPIFRYMRNDLNQLTLRCANRDAGCEEQVSLENLSRHEAGCGYGKVTCPNAHCRAELERRGLESHLLVCEHRTRVCPLGCGLTVLNSEVDSHNCVAELRTELELLRSEMIGRSEDQKHEMKLRLDSQRTHMVHKISEMQQQMDELKRQVEHLQHDVRLLSALERKRGQDMERLELEKKELLEVLKALKEEHELAKANTCRITAL